MAKKKAHLAIPDDYPQVLEFLKHRVRHAQTKAMLSANSELIGLYWDIGRQIAQRQQDVGWGRGVVDQLSKDLRSAFPEMKGFSASSLWRMRAFCLAYQDLAQPVRDLETPQDAEKLAPIVRVSERPPEALLGIPWGHNVVLFEKVKGPEKRLWYAAKTVEHGWSRAVLTVQIESGLFERQGKAITNFDSTLPNPQSDLAQQSLKDPYVFDFLTLHDDAVERDLERGLVDHVQKFLLELGAGFAFVGRQVPLSVADEDDFLDLLFYHLKLRCFVVIDLKMRKFSPADAGQMNYYLSAVDDLMRHPDDAPTIGLILCKSKDRIKAEYALRDINKPIGISEWQTKLVDSLPESLKGSLPTIEQIEAELESEDLP
jgi:predicted nuclease of restriction endonuclease-like (RecB) superfamily